MNLSEYLVDDSKAKNGVWKKVEYFAGEDIEVKVIPLDSPRDPAVVVEAANFIEKHSKELSNEAISTYVYATSIVDWKGLTWDGTTPCEYSLKLCFELFTDPEYIKFKQAFTGIVLMTQNDFSLDNPESVISDKMAEYVKKK